MTFPNIFSIFKRSESQKNDFSAFFREAPAEKQKQVLEEVVRKANHDQKKIVEQYRKLQSKTAR